MNTGSCCGRFVVVGVAVVVSGLFVGCGKSANPPSTADDLKRNNLLEVGELLRMYQMEKKQPPKSLADIQSVESLEMAAPMGLEPIRTNAIEVRWNATLPDLGEEPGQTPDNEVLAYFKEVPVSGGPVLLLNRTVVTMTPEEFKAAPKAGNEPAAK